MMAYYVMADAGGGRGNSDLGGTEWDECEKGPRSQYPLDITSVVYLPPLDQS